MDDTEWEMLLDILRAAGHKVSRQGTIYMAECRAPVVRFGLNRNNDFESELNYCMRQFAKGD